MFNFEYKNNNIYIYNTKNFDLPQTLDCGQAFRWRCLEGEKWCGVANDHFLELEKINQDTIVLYNTKTEEFEDFWKNYFDLERNYAEIIEKISSNEILKTATKFGNGIRILNQEPWETLCSFIISQNNNIKRIKGIIERFCELFGENKGNYYAFPKAEDIAKLTVEDLAPIRSGFRAKYIIDAAKKITSGEVNLNALSDMTIDNARNELMKIKGVGPKVADCALLFSHKHIEAFPQDVWIKRAMQSLFGGELTQEAKEYAGIVQQYIFFYARENKID